MHISKKTREVAEKRLKQDSSPVKAKSFARIIDAWQWNSRIQNAGRDLHGPTGNKKTGVIEFLNIWFNTNVITLNIRL